jgi:hypothetical protein
MKQEKKTRWCRRTLATDGQTRPVLKSKSTMMQAAFVYVREWALRFWPVVFVLLSRRIQQQTLLLCDLSSSIASLVYSSHFPCLFIHTSAASLEPSSHLCTSCSKLRRALHHNLSTSHQIDL